jgi:predicted  nucleic acid-binding Zn-ribbon protein
MTGKEKLEKKKERLELYYTRERLMLSQKGIQSYGIGSKNIERYNTDLAKIQEAIEKLEEEIEELEKKLKGESLRKTVAVVMRDW